MSRNTVIAIDCFMYGLTILAMIGAAITCILLGHPGWATVFILLITICRREEVKELIDE